jgi:preprotein translocase SecE subunit
MATAVEHGSEPRTPATPVSLPISSLIGAIYVAAMIAVVLYLIPMMWTQVFGGQVVGNSLIDWSLRQTLRVAAAIVLLLVGRSFLGAAPRKGIRGGIFLILAIAAIDFFIWRAIALNVNGTTGMALSIAFGAILLFFTIRFLIGRHGEAWMVALEEQGWFHAAAYKRILGQRVRRLTMLGILLLGGTGVYSLYVQGVLPDDWVLSMPYDLNSFVLLPDARLMIPLLLMILTLWVAYRAVNVPSFAEFLIATEAEMNKVSWTPRRRLGQDTIVVLATTLLMALFLLVVDIFWGWLLSSKLIGVLPVKSTDANKGQQVQQARW